MSSPVWAQQPQAPPLCTWDWDTHSTIGWTYVNRL
jgi:hypothetical protein